MTRRQGSKNEAIRKLTKTGEYTYYVTIPKSYISDLGWRERQRLIVKKVGKRLIIKDWK